MRLTETKESAINRFVDDFDTEIARLQESNTLSNVVRVLRVLNTRLKFLENEVIRQEKEGARKKNRFFDCETIVAILDRMAKLGASDEVQDWPAIYAEAEERLDQIKRQEKVDSLKVFMPRAAGGFGL